MALFRSRATLAIWLVLAPISARLAADVPQSVELPAGDEFREKMLTWSADPDGTQPATRRIVQKAGPAPAALPRLSSNFGLRGDPFVGGSRMHSGIDIPGVTGTPVLASGGGVVSFAGSAGGYGNMIEIDHGAGLRTRYAHLSRIYARSGSLVSAGETIALMGSTGRSTGSHLHFEVRHNGRPANPLAYLGGNAPVVTSYTVWNTRTEPHISKFARSREGRR